MADSNMEKFDIVIIGAGVIGLAIAKELSGGKKQYRLAVLERHDSFGSETSSRNSEVVHGGMYYPNGSLKARLCVEGRRLLYENCQAHKIAYKKTGKLIIATVRDELKDLERLFSQGKNNGVERLKMYAADEIKSRESGLCGIAALFSGETGIVDSHRLMEFFFDTAKNNGVIVAFQSEVTGIEKLTQGYKILVRNNDEIVEIQSRIVINCAGLDSDTIAQKAGFDIKRYNYELYYCKGEYFRIMNSKAKRLDILAYPVPKPKSGGLGIHVTPDLGGALRLGPDNTYLNNRLKNYSVDETKRHGFYTSISRFMPFVDENDLIPDTAGIRPKLEKEGGDFRDFVIQEESDKGFPGFINLIGIESPGLTASLAIANYVKKMING